MSSDTIVALSTPVGRSSISVIRLSGEMSIKLANNLSRSKEPFVDRQAIFLPIYIESSEIIDEAIYTFLVAQTGSLTVILPLTLELGA